MSEIKCTRSVGKKYPKRKCEILRTLTTWRKERFKHIGFHLCEILRTPTTCRQRTVKNANDWPPTNGLAHIGFYLCEILGTLTTWRQRTV